MSKQNPQKEALLKAIDLVGSQEALAEKIKTKQQTVSWWLRKSGRVPAEMVIPIEQATCGKISRSLLRPDLYPVVRK